MTDASQTQDTARRSAPSLAELVVKAAIVHTGTYFVAGFIALNLFNYAGRFADEGLRLLMRPVGDPWVTAGLLFQPLRGALFGLCFYAIRSVAFAAPRGWLTMWLLLVVVGIIAPFGPAPGSIEGLIYTRLPLSAQLNPGFVEVLAQSLLLSLGLFYWVRLPSNRWLGWGLSLLAAAAILASLAGLFLAPHAGSV